jgi:hypothetical protein
MRWRDRNRRKAPKLFKPWRRFRHPQLGDVEIGGLLRTYLYNPTLGELATIAKNTYRFTVDHAAKHPWVRIEDVSVDEVADGVYRVRARVANRGELPTNVTNKAKSLARIKPVRVEFRSDDASKLLSQQAHYELGHLEGLTGGRVLEWFVRTTASTGRCEIHVRAGTGGNATEVVALRARRAKGRSRR